MDISLGRIKRDGIGWCGLLSVFVLTCSLGRASGKGFAVADLGELVDLTDSTGGNCTGFCWDPIFLFPGLIAVLFQVVAAVGKSMYIPTLEGSSQVATKAKARAMRFISPEDEPRNVPASGRYRAQYKEVSEWKVATYDLKFDPSGVVEGLCVDEDGQFRVHGLYNPSTAGFTWAEYPLGEEDYISNSSPGEIDYFVKTARPFHTEVEVKMSLSSDTMEGSYHAASELSGTVMLQLQHPFFHEYSAIDFANVSVASGVMSTTYVASTSEPSTSSGDSNSHEREDSAEDISTIKRRALTIMDSARERDSVGKCEIQPTVLSPSSRTTASSSEIEPYMPEDEVMEERVETQKGWTDVRRYVLSPPVIEKYGLPRSSSHSTSGWYRGLLKRLMEEPKKAPDVMVMNRNEEDGLTERLLDGV